jgi:hypothetical protein
MRLHVANLFLEELLSKRDRFVEVDTHSILKRDLKLIGVIQKTDCCDHFF